MTEEKAKTTPFDILLAEDNQADAKITMRAFKQTKYENTIHHVCDGQEALDFICHEGAYQNKEKYPRPDIILLDINMPKVDGYGVLKFLKESEEYNYIPVVMLTSSKNHDDVTKSYGHGACSYIQKPVSYEEFQKVIECFNFYWHVINKLPNGKRSE